MVGRGGSYNGKQVRWEELDLVETKGSAHSSGHFKSNLGVHLLTGAFSSRGNCSSVLCLGSGGSIAVEISKGNSFRLD